MEKAHKLTELQNEVLIDALEGYISRISKYKWCGRSNKIYQASTIRKLEKHGFLRVTITDHAFITDEAKEHLKIVK